MNFINRPSIFTFCILQLILVSCSSNRQNNSANEPVQPVSPSIAAGAAFQGEVVDTELSEEELEDEDAYISDVEDAEFCKDNIYAQYLRDQYLRTHSKAVSPEKAFKPTRKSRRRIATRSPYDARDVEALFYARSRMVGQLVPYFGAIPVVTNPRVEHWIRYFKNGGRKAFLRWLVRGESVRDVVLPILKEQGLPPEFIFLSMVESGFSNSAYSHAKATGPWQFMPGTAKLYGLEMNMWIDERRDPAKSTLAAARLLGDLYSEFGDWYLAMAAYNAGPGRVRGAIRRAGSSDFWNLANSPYLPVETKNYVPKVLAALTLASNPKGHGFEIVADPSDILPTTQVVVDKPASLQEISQKLEISELMLRRWNPELVNSITPPAKQGKSYALRVAPHMAEKWPDIAQNLEYLDVKDVLMHRIRRGETIRSIASRYRVDVKKIISMNPGLSASRLKIGTEVAVPTAVAIPQPRVQRSRRVSVSADNRG